MRRAGAMIGRGDAGTGLVGGAETGAGTGGGAGSSGAAPVVGAAVLHYRRGAEAAATVRALEGQDIPLERVVVVDNASGDGTLAELEEAVPGVAVLRRPTNGGYAAGMRDAVLHLAESGCEVAVLVTHDCLLEPDAVRRMVQALADRDLGLVGPVLRDARTGRVWSSGGRIAPASWTPLNRTDVPVERVARRTWLDGACLVGPVDVLARPELWDERYFLYLEDVHVGLAVRELGRGVAVVRDARATQTSGGMPVFYAARNRLLLARRFASRGQLVRRVATDVLSLASTCAQPRRRHWWGPQSRGLREGLRGRGGPPPRGVDAGLVP